jgi:hypothetical protein
LRLVAAREKEPDNLDSMLTGIVKLEILIIAIADCRYNTWSLIDWVVLGWLLRMRTGKIGELEARAVLSRRNSKSMMAVAATVSVEGSSDGGSRGWARVCAEKIDGLGEKKKNGGAVKVRGSGAAVSCVGGTGWVDLVKMRCGCYGWSRQL